MTSDVKRRTVETVMAAAAAAAPCELVIQRHPIERDEIAAQVARLGRDPGVTIRLVAARPVPGTRRRMVARRLAGRIRSLKRRSPNVPVLTINATGGPPPMPFAEEGISLGATNGAEAAAAVRALLGSNALWIDAVERAREARWITSDPSTAARLNEWSSS